MNRKMYICYLYIFENKTRWVPNVTSYATL